MINNGPQLQSFGISIFSIDFRCLKSVTSSKFSHQAASSVYRQWFVWWTKHIGDSDNLWAFEIQDLSVFDCMTGIRGKFKSTFDQLLIIAVPSYLVQGFYVMINRGPSCKALGFQFFRSIISVWNPGLGQNLAARPPPVYIKNDSCDEQNTLDPGFGGINETIMRN